MNQFSPLCIIKKKEFLQSRPDGWRDVQGKLRNVDDEFNVMVQDKNFEGRDTFYEVDSLEELEIAKDFINRKPIFTTAKCRKPYDDSPDSDTSMSFLEDEYVVLVNTSHAEIANQFQMAFNQAEKYMREGKNFRVSVCLTESLKEYYNANVHAHGEANHLTYVDGCDIHITHGAKAPNCADTCFACKTSPQIAMWVTCFPIYLLTGVPYRIYKSCIKGLKEQKIKQVMPVTVYQGPFQTGYSLLSLMYAAPVVTQVHR